MAAPNPKDSRFPQGQAFVNSMELDGNRAPAPIYDSIHYLDTESEFGWPDTRPRRNLNAMSLASNRNVVASSDYRSVSKTLRHSTHRQYRSDFRLVTVLGTAIDETLAAVFGHATVEYDRYKSAARLDNGLVVVSLGREFGSRSEYQDTLEARQYLAEGKQKALALLRQAVRGLKEEIDEESTITNVPVELAFSRTQSSIQERLYRPRPRSWPQSRSRSVSGKARI